MRSKVCKASRSRRTLLNCLSIILPFLIKMTGCPSTAYRIAGNLISRNPTMIVKALQANRAMNPFLMLRVESMASEAPMVPIEMAETKLKKVSWAISFLPISLVNTNKVIKAIISLMIS
ncbi:hypothetical protein STFR1_60180 [Bacillus vallismortis]